MDAAAVYANASTRFTDGFEFGFGAEIGISTQKLHARGPMGLAELTSTKYVIYGNGQDVLRKTLDLKIKGFSSSLMCILHMRLFTVPQSILDIF